MTKLDNAWAAGIIDGEGCISIKTNSGKYYYVSVVVGQSGRKVPPMLERLKSNYGGSFCWSGQHTALDRKQHRMPKRNWQVVCVDAMRFLLKIRPYLVQKANQADVALQFRKYVKRPGKRRGIKLLKQQRRLFLKIHNMKHYEKENSHARQLVSGR